MEEADHKTLMEQNGLYAEMYQRQFRLEDIWGGDQDIIGASRGP